MWCDCVSQDQDDAKRAVWESHEKLCQGPSFPWLESCIKVLAHAPGHCLSYAVRQCLVTWYKQGQKKAPFLISQGSHSSPLNCCQAHRAEIWQWNLWQLKPWFCWKEACVLNIHARKLCQSQHYYTQLCLEKERKTDMYIRGRSHELRKKTHNEFKLD